MFIGRKILRNGHAAVFPALVRNLSIAFYYGAAIVKLESGVKWFPSALETGVGKSQGMKDW